MESNNTYISLVCDIFKKKDYNSMYFIILLIDSTMQHKQLNKYCSMKKKLILNFTPKN